MRPESDWSEVGRDLLDPEPAPSRWLWLPARRLALGVGATATPTVLFVLLGAVAGPHGLGILSPAALGHLDAVVSVALALIGVFVGLGTAGVVADVPRYLRLSSLAALVTTATVAAGLYILVTRSGVPVPIDPAAFALVVGICASVSAAVHVGPGPDDGLRRAARIADLDDVPLIALGALAIAMLAGGPVVRHLLLAGLVGGAMGAAGWLLFERAEGSAERGVFLTGAILLLAGLAAYLRTSPLLTGCIAALVWVRTPGAADRLTAADLRVLQHPLVALLLIVAGALVEWTAAVLWIAAPLVLLRLTGKLLASLAIAPALRVSPTLLATVLLPPGIMGIALALNVRQVLETADATIVSAVITAAAASELLAVFVARSHEAAG